jgi:hypothetical protein
MHVANEAANAAVVHWECSDVVTSHTGSYSGIFFLI